MPTIGLFLAINTVVAPGDEVIVPSPYFASYKSSIMMCGGVVVPVALRPENGMHLNAADIEAAVTDRTRGIIINSPGNPSGAVTTAEELAQVAEVCKKHNIWAISDEVYHSIVYSEGKDGRPATAPSIAAVPGMKARTIVVESLSKTYAMTGGASVIFWHQHASSSRPAKIAANGAFLRQFGIPVCRRGRNDRPAGTGRRHAPGIFRQTPDCRRRAGRLFQTQSDRAGWARSTRSSMCELPAWIPTIFSRGLLQDKHVAVVPGEAFGEEGRGFVRLSYAGDADELREGLRRMRDFAERNR